MNNAAIDHEIALRIGWIAVELSPEQVIYYARPSLKEYARWTGYGNRAAATYQGVICVGEPGQDKPQATACEVWQPTQNLEHWMYAFSFLSAKQKRTVLERLIHVTPEVTAGVARWVVNTDDLATILSNSQQTRAQVLAEVVSGGA